MSAGVKGLEVDVRFVAALQALDKAREEHSARRKEMQEECGLAMGILWQARFPKRKSPGIEAACLEVPEIADAYLQWQETARELLRKQQIIQVGLARKLDAVAMDPEVTIPLLPAEQKILWKSVSTDTYRSQGFSQVKYAREAAEAFADKARLHGLIPEIRKVNEHDYRDNYHNTWHCCEFQVWVNTTALGLELLNRKSGVSTREWVKSCWRRGVNPRVYNAFLPQGYEESVGLDYHGNDVPARGSDDAGA